MIGRHRSSFGPVDGILWRRGSAQFPARAPGPCLWDVATLGRFGHGGPAEQLPIGPDDGQHTIAVAMRGIKVKAIHRVEVRDAKGAVSEVTARVKYHRLRVHPSIGKQKEYPLLMLTVIHAQEASAPRGREKIDWKLITNLPVRSHEDAVEKLAWYAMRWRMETFHKILKSGCRAEHRSCEPQRGS